MTREKKELLKQLAVISQHESLEYSIGEMSPAAIQALDEEVERQRRPLLLRLNELMHGKVNDYFQACVI